MKKKNNEREVKNIKRCSYSNKFITGREIILIEYAIDYIKQQGYEVVQSKKKGLETIVTLSTFGLFLGIIMLNMASASQFGFNDETIPQLNPEIIEEEQLERFTLQFNQLEQQNTQTAQSFQFIKTGEVPHTFSFGTDGRGQVITRDYIITGIGVAYDVVNNTSPASNITWDITANFFEVRLQTTMSGSDVNIGNFKNFHFVREVDEVPLAQNGNQGDVLMVDWRRVGSSATPVSLRNIIVTLEGYYV